MNWFEAGRYCEKLGGTLASIHSNKEMNSIKNLLSSYSKSSMFWLGLNKLNSSFFEWNDKSTYKFGNWKKGEPTYLNEYCTKVESNGFWSAISCFLVGGWVCKLEKGVIPPTTKIIVQETFPGKNIIN